MIKILAILKKVAMALIANAGGASGPLYGTAFMKAAAEVNGKESIDIGEFSRLMKAALQGIKMRGKAEVGEKTMVDAIEPAVKTIEYGISSALYKYIEKLKLLWYNLCKRIIILLMAE